MATHVHRDRRAASDGEDVARPNRGGLSRRKRRWLIALACLAGAFALLHWGGGLLAKEIINRKLARMEKYTAQIGSVRLALWRGAAEVKDFVLRERDKPNEPPLVRVKHASFSAALAPFLRGRLGGDGLVEEAEILFAKHHAFAGPKDAAEKAAAEAEEKKATIKRWQDVLSQSLPIEVYRFELKNARVRYLDRAHQPNVDVEIRRLDLVVTGLQNRPEPHRELPTQLELTGITTGDGKLKLRVGADPSAKVPRFAGTFELRELSLPELNTFMRAYVGADVSRGSFEVYSEVKADNGSYQGYVKPFFRELDFKNVHDPNKNLAERAKEKVVSAVSSLLKNDEEQKVATITPFSGTLGGGQVDLWETVHQLFRNAFVEALREGLESQKPSG